MLPIAPSGRAEFVEFLKITSSILFRRYRPTDRLPRNRERPPTVSEVMALEARYSKQMVHDGAFLLEENLEYFLAENLSLLELVW